MSWLAIALISTRSTISRQPWAKCPNPIFISCTQTASTTTLIAPGNSTSGASIPPNHNGVVAEKRAAASFRLSCGHTSSLPAEHAPRSSMRPSRRAVIMPGWNTGQRRTRHRGGTRTTPGASPGQPYDPAKRRRLLTRNVQIRQN